MVEWLALLLHIQEFPGLNLGLETSYLDSNFFVAFVSLSWQML
jgi:hypothetical protein